MDSEPQYFRAIKEYSEQELLDILLEESEVPFSIAIGVEDYGLGQSTCSMLINHQEENKISYVHCGQELELTTTTYIDHQVKNGIYYIMPSSNDDVAVLTAKLERIKLKNSKFPYNYNHSKLTFFLASGVLVCEPKKGLTCATFVSVLLQSVLNIELLDLDHWMPRHEDHRYLVDDLRVSQSKLPRFRIRPEDVAVCVGGLDPNILLRDQGPIPFKVMDVYSRKLARKMRLRIADYFEE